MDDMGQPETHKGSTKHNGGRTPVERLLTMGNELIMPDTPRAFRNATEARGTMTTALRERRAAKVPGHQGI